VTAAVAYHAFSLRRVGAMVLRYWYLLRYSWPRIVDLIYWPAVQMLMWGFLQLYLTQHTSMVAQAGGAFIGAVLLWDILFRGQIGFSVSFLEEMWSRNLGNLMMTPLRPSELVASLMVMSIVRVAIGLVPVTFLAILFFGFNLSASPLGFLFVIALSMFGFAAVGTLFSALVSSSRLQGGLLALVVFPLTLPLVISSNQVMVRLSDGSNPFGGAAFALVIAFDVVFVIASWLTFEWVIEP